jgi:hypothetical protein
MLSCGLFKGMVGFCPACVLVQGVCCCFGYAMLSQMHALVALQSQLQFSSCYISVSAKSLQEVLQALPTAEHGYGCMLCVCVACVLRCVHTVFSRLIVHGAQLARRQHLLSLSSLLVLAVQPSACMQSCSLYYTVCSTKKSCYVAGLV